MGNQNPGHFVGMKGALNVNFRSCAWLAKAQYVKTLAIAGQTVGQFNVFSLHFVAMFLPWARHDVLRPEVTQKSPLQQLENTDQRKGQ